MITISTQDQGSKNNLQINYPYLTKVSLASALGGLLFGFDTAIISGAISGIEKHFGLNNVTLGWAVSCILIGCAIGASVAGILSDKFGRKNILILCAVLFGLTGLGVGLSDSLTVFVLFRISSGLAVGAAAMVAPMYIAETVPSEIRGKLVSVYQLAIVFGILLAYCTNLSFSGVKEDWRWMFSSQVVPSVLFLVCLLYIPETPRWLLGAGKKDMAFDVLKKIGGQSYAVAELSAIENGFSKSKETGYSELLNMPTLKVLFMGCIIATFQQITGINAILYYAPEIFKLTGIDTTQALQSSIGIGIVMFFSTLIAIFYVDKFGRKSLLFWGCLLMAISLVVVALCFKMSYFDNYLIFIFLLIYIASFSASLGAVTWVIISEIFPNKIRALAMSISTLVLWIADFAASYAFPIFNMKYGISTTLSIFVILCIVYCVYIWIMIPETKGKSLEEIEKEII
ncbi:MAG: sugar porter family MFS transporter [Leadbetterella sp.]